MLYSSPCVGGPQDFYGTDAADVGGRGLQLVLYVCAACSLLGAVWTLFFTVETQHYSIEALDAGHKDGDVSKLGGDDEEGLGVGLMSKGDYAVLPMGGSLQ